MKKEILIDRAKRPDPRGDPGGRASCASSTSSARAQEKLAGNIYHGPRAERAAAACSAAFVDIGTGKNAFLYLGDEGPDKRDLAFPGQEAQIRRGAAGARSSPIRTCSCRSSRSRMGPRARGSRRTSRCPGATSSSRRRWTMSASPAASRRRGSAQRLKAEAERVKPAGMGLIVRTAAEGRSGEDFLEDVRELTALWEQIVGRVRAGRAPCCVHRDDGPDRPATLRDLLTGDVDSIVLADAAAGRARAGRAARVRAGAVRARGLLCGRAAAL